MRLFVIAHSGVLASFRKRWEALARRGHAVTLLAPEVWTEGNRWIPLEETEASAVHLIRKQPFGDFWPSPVLRNVASLQLGLSRLLRRTRPDVLEVFEEPYSLGAWHALRTARAVVPEALRLVFSAQNIPKTYPWPFSRFESDVLSWTDAALPVDPLVVPVLRGKGLKAPAPVVPLGVDPEQFRPVSRVSERIPEAARSGTVVGYLGKLQREKGVMDLVEAVRRLSRPTHLVVAGAGPLEGRLRKAAESGVRLHLLGPVPQREVPELLAGFDVVCVPSRTTGSWMEQFGRSAVEAMACGRPTMVSDSGSLPHVVGESARIVPEADPRAWSQALEDLLGDPEARAELGRRGRTHALARYSWEAVARTHEEAWAAARDFRGN